MNPCCFWHEEVDGPFERGQHGISQQQQAAEWIFDTPDEDLVSILEGDPELARRAADGMWHFSKPRVVFDDMQLGDKKPPSFLGAVLLCPRCNSHNLHHKSVGWYYGREDSKNLTYTFVHGNSVHQEKVSRRGSGNPSQRRHGFVVDFSCEDCGSKDLELNFSQEKGETVVEWRVKES